MNRCRQAVRWGFSSVLYFGTLLLSSCSSSPKAVSTPTSPSTPAPATLIYAAQTGIPPAVINVFSATATGTASPTATLTLPTDCSPASLVTDSSGQIYVGCQEIPTSKVLVYAAGSTGNVTPLRSVVVPSAPFELAVDASGLLYVGLTAFNATAPSVYVYSAAATGSSAPVRTLEPAGIQDIIDLATDSSGNLFIAAQGENDDGLIAIYPPGASGMATPSRTIQGSFLFEGLTVDSSNNLFATTDGPDSEQLVEFSPSASGSAVPINTFTLSHSVSQSSGIGNVRRDAAGNLYFGASVAPIGSHSSTVTIYTFASDFSSKSSPVRTFNPSPSALQIAVN